MYLVNSYESRQLSTQYKVDKFQVIIGDRSRNQNIPDFH